jgi:tetratricopeptide (TPR) repeat protein
LGYHRIHLERVLFRKAETSYHAGDFVKAASLYRRAEAAGLKGHPALLLKLAQALSWTRQYEEAAALYRAVLREDPGNRSLRIALARVLTWDGRFAEAVIEYRKALGETK